jgi:Domain of unknown function (DUF6487)
MTTMPTVTCPKCSKAMDEGFIVDHTHGGSVPPQWVEGPPQVSFWTGLKLRGKVLRGVATYCCPGCGYLESYAKPEQEES